MRKCRAPQGVCSSASAARGPAQVRELGTERRTDTRGDGGAGEIRTREPGYPGYGISSAAPSTGLGDRSAPVDSIRVSSGAARDRRPGARRKDSARPAGHRRWLESSSGNGTCPPSNHMLRCPRRTVVGPRSSCEISLTKLRSSGERPFLWPGALSSCRRSFITSANRGKSRSNWPQPDRHPPK